MARLSHEKHLEYCRWYYLKNREKLKQMALLNYYRKHPKLNCYSNKAMLENKKKI